MTPSDKEHREEAATAVRRGLRRWILRIALVPVIAYGVWLAVLYFMQGPMLFPGQHLRRPTGPAPDEAVVTSIDIGRGQRNLSWFFPASSLPGWQGPAVVFFHGNGELIDSNSRIANGYRKLGLSVLLPEYRGFGRADGKPSQDAIVEDCVRFYDKLARRPDVDPKRIVFHGRSLGGGVAAQVATRRKPAALFMEITFTSIASMAHGYWAPESLVRHPFRTDAVICDIACPLLIIGATNDVVVPVQHSRKLHELRPDATYFEFDGGHHDYTGGQYGEQYWKLIHGFLSQSGILQ